VQSCQPRDRRLPALAAAIQDLTFSLRTEELTLPRVEGFETVRRWANATGSSAALSSDAVGTLAPVPVRVHGFVFYGCQGIGYRQSCVGVRTKGGKDGGLHVGGYDDDVNVRLVFDHFCYAGLEPQSL
jgi:hypothetical protein